MSLRTWSGGTYSTVDACFCLNIQASNCSALCESEVCFKHQSKPSIVSVRRTNSAVTSWGALFEIFPYVGTLGKVRQKCLFKTWLPSRPGPKRAENPSSQVLFKKERKNFSQKVCVVIDVIIRYYSKGWGYKWGKAEPKAKNIFQIYGKVMTQSRQVLMKPQLQQTQNIDKAMLTLIRQTLSGSSIKFFFKR